ncbi:MAG: membrane protein insertion efficiency factor YidD [Proteobacteria bacterium]|nr:membrane protein insertion efficiency factor YidD [Pseudomonadota bacterium]
MKLKTKVNRIATSPFLIAIGFYQRFVSLFFPPSCIYWPSCSEYSKQAFRKHGFFWGIYLTVFRLIRCHPFHQGGVDEVPESVSFFK